MTKHTPTRRPIHHSEQGYVILFAIFLMALLVISLAIAAPQVAKSIQRDRDLETWHRGMQYRRAVQLYCRKFRNTYPPTLDALVETNNTRFLRKKYIDPITGKADWKPILFGQNKVPGAMGFFGEPLAGGTTSIAGIGPSGGNGAGGSGGSLPGGISDIFGGSSSTSTSSPGPTDASAGTSGGTGGSTGSTGTATSGTSPSGGTGSSTGSDQAGQTFGGGGIIGFSPASPKKSILIYKKKDHYNEWEFTYDPISDQKVMTGGNAGSSGLPVSGGAPSPGGTPPTAPTPPGNQTPQQ